MFALIDEEDNNIGMQQILHKRAVQLMEYSH